MSKVLKVLLVSAYSTLLLQYLTTTLTTRKNSIELEYIVRQPESIKKILREIKRNGANLTLRKLELNFKKPERFATDLKYILKWTQAFSHYTSSIFPNGQSIFIGNQCKYNNCFLTNDKRLLVDLRYYDAIIFDVENNWDYQPIVRAPHQSFIFTASESASNYPICPDSYDSYYNLTWTYRLDSDIRWSFVTIMDKNGQLVGPNINMTWIEHMKPTPENVIRRLVHKKKAAAWFVSNCNSRSQREKVAAKLNDALAKFNLKIDIYGWCGQLTCSRDRMEDCLDLLEQDYYFYLAFENSFSEDYVTEKLLYPLGHFAVPIVYGGANYSRFLPPGSYINAGELNSTEIAFKMNDAIKNPLVYRNYFRWQNHYVYKESPTIADVCRLCQTLNDPARGHTVVKDFRQWWNSDYEKLCADDLKPHTYEDAFRTRTSLGARPVY